MTPEERRRILGLEPDENAPSSMSETQRRSILGLDPRAPSEPGAPAPLSDDERRSILGLDALAAPAAPAPPSAPVQRFANPPPAPAPERARGTGMDALHDIGAGLAGIIPTAESTVRGTIQSNRHLGLYDRDERMETLKERIAGPRPEEDKLYFKMGDLELGSREIQQGLSNLGFSLPSQVAGLGASAITQRLTGNPKASAKAGMITSAAMGGLTGYRTQFNDFMVMARDAYRQVHPLATGAEWEDYRERVVIPAARRYGFHEAAWEAVGEGVGRALPGAKIPLTAPLQNAILQKLANGSIKTLADLTVELGGETITQVGQNRALADIGLVDQKPEWTDPRAWRRAFVEVGPTVAIMSGAHMATGAAMQGAYDARARARAERAALPPARSTARDAASTPLSEPMSARNATVRAEDIRIHEPPRAMEASPEAAPSGVDQERELALAQTVGRELAGSDEATLEARDLAYAAMAQGRYGDVDAALGFWRSGQRESARQALLGPTPGPAVERPSLGPTQPDSIQPLDHTTSNPKGGGEHGVQERRQGQGTVESSEPPAAIPPAVPTEPPAALPPPRALPEAYRDEDGVWYTRETDGAWTMLDNPARLATEDRARALETRYQQEQAARAQREAKAETPRPPSPPEPPDAGVHAPPPPSPPPEAPESPAPPAFTPDERAANPYLGMPIERVMRDAEQGVALAREALNRRQSESPKSARAAAPVVPPPPPTPAPAAPSPPPPPKKPIPPRSPPSGMSALRRAPWHTMLLVETDEGGQRTALQWLDEEPKTLKPGQSVETYGPDPRRISYQSANPEEGRAEQAPGLDAFVDTIRRKAGYQFMLAEQTPEGWRMLGWARKPAGLLKENQYLIHFWDKTPGARISAYGDVDADTMPYLSFVLENGGLLHPDKIFNPLHGGLIDRPAGQRAGGEYDSVRALEEYINNLSGTKRNSPWARELLGGTLAPDLMAQMMSDPQEGFTGAPLDPTGDLVEQMSAGLRRDIDRYVQRREDIRAGRLQRGARRTDDDVIRDQENAWAQQQFEEDAQKAMGAFSARTDFGDDIAGQGHKALSQIAVFLQAEQAAGRMDAARAADEWTRAYAQIQEKIEQHTATQKTPPIVQPAATLDDEDPWAETGGDGLPFARRPQPSGAMLDFGVSELPLFTHLSVPASDRTTAEAQATVDTAQAEAQADRDAQAEAEAEAFALEADIQDATRAEGPVADAGAKIGGARKDQAPVRRRPRAATEEEADALLPAWRRRFEIAQDAINHRFFLIEKAKRGTPQGRMMRSFGMNGRILSGFDYATRAEAEAALPVAAASVDHRIRSYQDEQNRERFAILRVLSNGNMPPVKTGFATRDEAITYMVRHAAEILEYRFEMPKRPYLSEIQRTGPDRRGGRDVSAQSFVDTFGFRAAEFGNWNLGQDGQASLNHAYDALMDLADALGVPPRALSLHGELAVAFGARGKGGLNGSSAHYEPDYGVINLTKPRGAGALAHEWFHALDAYFYRRGQSPEPVRLGDYQTFGVQQRGLLSAQASATTTALRPELVGAYRELLKAMQREDVPMDASDLDLAQRAVESTRREIERIVESLALNMQTYHARGYMRRARAPTETELSTFRQLGETLKNPDGLGERVSVEPTGINPQTQRMRYFSATFSSWPALRAMNDIYKSVTGRGFDTADPHSEGRRLDGYIWHLKKYLADAQRIQNDVSATKIQPTQYLRNAKDADRYRSSAYWALAHEMAARAFEQFAEDRMRSRGQRSPYLVHSTDNRFYGELKIYPDGADRANLARHFARFFDQTLLNRERAGGVELYRTPAPGAVLAQSPRADRVELRSLARRMLGDGVQLEFVERLLAGGLDRLGAYRARLMRIVDGKGTPRNTLLHESVHAAEDLLLTPGERARLEAFQPDAEARAEGFVSYAARRRGIAGQMRAIWDVLIARLRALFGRNNGADAFRDFYGRLLMGYYARRGELGTPTPTEIAYRTPASVREGEATRSEAERAAPADGGAAALEALRQLDFLTALYAPPKAKALPARPPDAIRIYPRAMPEPAMRRRSSRPAAIYPVPTPGNRTALPPPRDTALAQAANAKAFTDQSTAEDWNRAFQEGQGGAYAFMLEKLEDRTSERAYMQSLMGLKINTALDYAAMLLPLRRPDIERVMVGVLDNQDRIACVECVTVGILDASLFERREIFNVAVRAMDRGVKVSGIIVSHNHPSGDPTPSQEDIFVTRKLRNAGKVMGIPLRYHIITNGKTFSYSLPAANDFSDGDEVVFDVATFDPTHRAEWENRPSAELPKIWGPMSYAKVAQLMAGGAGPNRAHVIVVNTKQRIVAAFRLEIPREPDGSVRHDDLARACVQLAITQPARGIFFDSDMSTADTHKMILRLRAHANTMGLDLFDAAMGGIPQNPNNGIKEWNVPLDRITREAPAGYAGAPVFYANARAALDETRDAPAFLQARRMIRALPDIVGAPLENELRARINEERSQINNLILGLPRHDKPDMFGGTSAYQNAMAQAAARMESWRKDVERLADYEARQGDLFGGMRFMAGAAAPAPFYSMLARAVEGMKQAAAGKAMAMPGDQMLNRIRALPGVKKQEIEESGLADWLRMQKEQGRNVTRDDVRAFLEQHGVQIVPVHKGARPGVLEWDGDELMLNGTAVAFISDDGWRGWSVYDSYVGRAEEGRIVSGLMTRAESEQAAEGFAREGNQNFTDASTKYSGYAPPGGISGTYREVLLRVPGPMTDSLGKDGEYEIFMDGAFLARVGNKAQADRSIAAYAENPVNAGHTFEARPTRIWTGLEKNLYQSQHWNESNVIAHMLMDERRIPLDELQKTMPELAASLREQGINEARALHMIEGQSDLHQTGAVNGYATDPTKESATAAGYSVYRTKSNLGTMAYFIEGPDNIRGIPSIGHDTEDAAWQELFGFLKSRSDAVPALPMRGDAWKRLILRTMLREAATGGYDLLTWSTGEDRFKKWGSQRVEWKKSDKDAALQERIAKYEAIVGVSPGKSQLKEFADEVGDGYWTVAAVEQSGGEHAGMNIEQAARERGQLLETKGQTVRTKDDLRRVIESIKRGDETNVDKLTERIWSRMQTEPEGTSLPRKEFFEFLYDQSLVSHANDILRTMDQGNRVEGATIGVGRWRVEGVYDPSVSFDARAKAEEYAQTVGIPLDRVHQEGDPAGVHAIAITDAIRSGVTAGQPYYQAGAARDAGGMSADQVRQSLGRAAEGVDIFDSLADLERAEPQTAARLRQAARMAGVRADTAPGVYTGDGRIIFFARNLMGADHAAEALFHEYTERGLDALRRASPDQMSAFLGDIYAGRLDQMEDYRRAAGVVRSRYGYDENTPEGRVEFAREVLAHIAQTRTERPDLWQRAVAALRRFLARLFQGTPLEARFAEAPHAVLGRMLDATIAIGARANETERIALARTSGMETIRQTRSALPPARVARGMTAPGTEAPAYMAGASPDVENMPDSAQGRILYAAAISAGINIPSKKIGLDGKGIWTPDDSEMERFNGYDSGSVSAALFELERGYADPFSIELAHWQIARARMRTIPVAHRDLLVASMLARVTHEIKAPDTYFDPMADWNNPQMYPAAYGEISNALGYSEWSPHEPPASPLREEPWYDSYLEKMRILLSAMIADPFKRGINLDDLLRAGNVQLGDIEAGGEFGSVASELMLHDLAREAMDQSSALRSGARAYASSRISDLTRWIDSASTPMTDDMLSFFGNPSDADIAKKAIEVSEMKEERSRLQQFLQTSESSPSPNANFLAGAPDRAADSKPDAWMSATGDVVRGDTIRFTEAVFAGSFRNPKFSGNREIVAEVLNDSYGRDKQQHTFTLRVIRSSGTHPLEAGVTTTRKGRNVYRNGTERLEWTDENARTMAASEKHTRGDAARRSRDVRRMADGAAFMAGEGSRDSQYAELERRAKAGDKQAEAEAQRMVDEAARADGVVDFSRNQEWHDIAYRDATPEVLSRLKHWLRDNPETQVRMYHGTDAAHDITGEGLLPTGRGRRHSLQSRSGFVSLSIYPDMARRFGQMAYPGKDIAVYAVDVPVRMLVADTDQLKNKRMWGGERYGQIGSSLADSIAYGHGAQVKGKIQRWAISRYQSADPFTYRDDGTLIPLSERFNPAASDIRFMAGEGTYGRGAPAVAWRDDMPNVLILRTARAMELRPEYKTAKAGDAEAARAVAQWALAGETEALGALAQAHPQARVVPVHGEAGNAIPAALARAIHGRYGLAVEDGIRKQPDSDAARRTGKDAWHRMVYRPRFDGPVTAGAEYILVDDVSTMGGTFSELRQHIERNGGRVVGMVAAATGKMGAKVALDPATRTALDMQFGREALSGWMREHGLYGGEVAALTEAEARALMREKSLADASVRHLKAQRAAERAGVPEVESAPEDLGSAMNLIRHKERAIRRLMEQHEDIHALQRNLHDLMRISRIPMEKRGRVISDIVRLSRPKSKDALFRYYQQAVEKLNRLDSWYAGDNLRQQAWEILRAETPKLSRKYPTGTRTPDTYREMARIRRIAGLTESERNARLKALADAVEARGEGAQMSPEEAHEQYLVDTFGALNDMGEDKARRAVNDLETLVKNGAFEHQASERERMARMEELRAMAQGVIRGGAYPMSQADRQRAKADAKGILDAIGNYMALQDSWETLLDNLSKFDRESSPLQSGLSYFTRLVHRATHDSETGLESQMRIITSNAARIFGVPEKKLGTVAAENGRVLKDTGVHFSYDREAGRQMPLSKNQAYKLWQLYLDPTLEHALDANGMDDRMRQELEAFIGPKVMEWARWQVDEFYPAYYQRINRVYRDMFHVDLPYHEGYSPAFREFSSAREDAKDLLGDESRQSTVMNGSLYSRIENERPFKLVDGDTVLFSHIGSMEHFINWADPVRTLRSTLGHESVQNAITERHGRDKAKIMNGFIKRFATGGDDRRVVYGLFERIRSNFSAAVIASPVTGLKQLSSFPAYMAEIPVMDFLGGVAEALSNPGKALRELSTSKMMQSRYRQGWERDVRLDMRRGKTAAPLSPRSLKSASRIFTELGDKASVVIGGYGVYRYHMKKALAEGRSEADARRIGLEEFELATERSQQAGGVKDLSELQSNPTTRMFTMFQTSPFSFMRMTRMALRNLYYGRGKRSDHIKRLAVFNFIIPMLFTWIAQGFRWRDDEEDKDKPTAIPGLPRAYARNVASAPFQGLFVAGPVVESMVSAYQQERVYSDIANKLVPFVRPADDIVRIAREIGDMVENDRITTDDVMDILGEAGEAGGMFLGIPTGPAMRSLGGVSAAVRGETPYPLRRTLGYSPTMMGEKKPRRSSKTLAGMGPALYTPVLPKPEIPKLLVPKLD